MIKAVIIDFDDTLCLSEHLCFDLENEMLALMGRKPQTREIHKQTWGQPLFEVIATRSPGVDIATFRKLVEENITSWVNEGRLDHLSPERLAVLDDILAQGKELHILTSRTHTEAAHLLAPDHTLASRIKTFYYRDNMKYHKPDPRAFEQVLDDHMLKPEECVYVGDATSDAAAAKQAGLHFIASLESGLRTKQDFDAFPVDLFIPDFSALPAAVAQLDAKLHA